MVGSRSTVQMKCHLIEMVRLSRVRSIGDEASGCIHVNRVKRCVDSLRPLDLHQCVKSESTCCEVISQKLHLNPIYNTCLIDDPVDSASTRSKRNNPRALIQHIVFSHVT